ncbi:hypothetical protein ABEF95_017054 [Exophiala dermatitidis]
MSNLLDTTWTVSEKIVLLTNVIQDAGHDVPSLLLQSISERNIQPRWADIPLPAGRSLNACRRVYDEMVRGPPQQPRSFPAVGPPGYPPQHLGPGPGQLRSASGHELQPLSTHRSIQPRPPLATGSPLPSVTNGEFAILRPFPSDPGVERRRKRGRPTKEEVEERGRRLAMTGQTYEPKKRAPKKLRLSGTPGSTAEVRPGSSPGLHAPREHPPERNEEASSVTRGPRQQTEEDDLSQQAVPQSPLDDSGNEKSAGAAESPSDRLLLRSRSGERAQGAVAAPQTKPEAQSPGVGREAETGHKV